MTNLPDNRSKETVDPTEHLPEPIRSLAKCGKVFGVAVDKKPFLPARWKEDKRLLKTYSEAVGARDELIADGKNAVVYMVMTDTPYRLLDFDPDKVTGQLRPAQIESLAYYRNKVNAPILESSSDVGRHIPVEDKDRQLPKIGSSLVEAGKIPFEIKHDLMYITGKIIHERPIPAIDQKTIDKVKIFQKSATTKPKAIRRSKKALADLREAIQWCYDNNITNVITNNATFSCFAIGSNQIGLPLDEQEEFCESQEGDKKDIRARLESTNDHPDDQRASLMSLFKKRGYESEDTQPPDETFIVAPSLGRKGGFEYCLNQIGIEVRYNELVGIEVKIPDKEWQELDDNLFETIANKIVAKKAVKRSNHGWIPFEPSNETMRSIYTSMAKENPPFNPTREWLKTIEAKEDLAAIDEFLSCYKIDGYDRAKEAGFTEDVIKEYYRAGVILMMAGWIMRSLKPGCLYDKLVVLIGDRGCGKGLGLMLQLPPQKVDEVNGRIIPNKAFSNKCRISDERKDWYVNRRCSLGEVTELIGFSKPGNEKIKALISSTTDKQELKYKNYALEVDKSHAWVGTSNNKHFKPADGEGDRRIYPLDLTYGFPGGKRVTREKIPKILNDDWRIRAVGHILWLLEKGYSADHRDWSDEVEELREFMIGQSSRHYTRIEQAFIAVAYGTTEYYRNEYIEGRTIKIEKVEWAFYKYSKMLNSNGYNEILRLGLPFNPSNYPEKMPTWMRLLTLHDKAMVDKYGVDTIKMVAREHMGWEWKDEPHERNGFKRCRNWLIPNPKHGDPDNPDTQDEIDLCDAFR